MSVGYLYLFSVRKRTSNSKIETVSLARVEFAVTGVSSPPLLL